MTASEESESPEMPAAPEEGQTRTVERTFTPEDVRTFAEVSGDTQPRHLEPDEEGRLLVHGLLTATIPTRIGSDLEVLARSMTFDFLKPVYTGETVTCELQVESVEERPEHYDLTASITCEKVIEDEKESETRDDGENGGEETVLSGTVEGLVPK